MAHEVTDYRMTSIHPRIRYNTIGGVNGPLVILDNVRSAEERSMTGSSQIGIGQISQIQRNRLFDVTRWLGEVGAGSGSSRYGRIQLLLADNSTNVAVYREQSCRSSTLRRRLLGWSQC